MFCKIREWRISDAADLATALSNKKVQDNLRDGLPFPYKESDGLDFINAMLSSDKNNTFINYSSSDFEGNNYEQVISQLEKQGFTNIKTQKIDDLVTGWITKDGEVEEVKIDGYSSFSTNSRYAPDVEIIVSYHTFSEK